MNPLSLLGKRFIGNANVIYRRRKQFHMHQAEVYSEHLASLGISDCLIGGDFTSTATRAEYRMGQRFVEGLVRHGMDVHLMPGNHDVYTFESVRAKRFDEYFGAHMPENGYPYAATLPGGTPLILVPTACPTYFSAAGHISDAEAEATRQLIEAFPAGPVLVAGHYPVLHHTASYSSSRSRQLRNADALRSAMGETGRRVLYIAGHVHRFSYTEDERYPNLHHLTTGAFFHNSAVENCRGAFSTIDTDDETFRVAWHKFDANWETTDVEVEAVPQK